MGYSPTKESSSFFEKKGDAPRGYLRELEGAWAVGEKRLGFGTEDMDAGLRRHDE